MPVRGDVSVHRHLQLLSEMQAADSPAGVTHTLCYLSKGPWPVTSSGESTRKKNEGMMEIKQLGLQCAFEKGACTCEPAPVGVPIFTEQLARSADETTATGTTLLG